MPDQRSPEAKRRSLIEFDFIGKHGMKICTRCKRMLPIDQFKKQSDRPHGLGSNCKDCCRKTQKVYISSDKGYFSEMLNGMTKALRSGRVNLVEFKNREELIEQWKEQQKMYGDFCPGTGKKLTMIRDVIKGNNQRVPTNISADRILNWEGYTKINTIFVSWEYNNMKNNMTPEIAINFLHMVKERFGELDIETS